jgi:hypothetical protein
MASAADEVIAHDGEGGGPAFEVRYADDDPHPFVEGTRRRFGRDDSVDDVIAIWEETRAFYLSKVAGEFWCADGQMWVRNLSQAHELVVEGSGSTAVVLPARAPDHPGFACSVPWPTGTVSAPSTGSWRLSVVARAPLTRRQPPAEDPAATLPAELRAVAEVLCAPMLRGRGRPATTQEVAAALDLDEREAARRIERLCRHHLALREDSGGQFSSQAARVAVVARELLASSLFATVRVDDVPQEHREVAEALCAPLLAGGSLPATYTQIAAVLGVTPRTARRRADELTDRYRAQVVALPGGVRGGETFTAAVARLLVHRGKVGRQ